MPLDLDQLQSFCAIADCGSFTEAARRVNKTQSAVSMQIKRLEERLGHPLLTRDGRTRDADPSRRGALCAGPPDAPDQCRDHGRVLGRDLSGLDPLRRAGRLCGAAAAGDPVELPAHPSQDRGRRALPAVGRTARGHEDGQVRPDRLHPGHQPRVWRTVPHRADVLGGLAWRAGAEHGSAADRGRPALLLEGQCHRGAQPHRPRLSRRLYVVERRWRSPAPC